MFKANSPLMEISFFIKKNTKKMKPKHKKLKADSLILISQCNGLKLPLKVIYGDMLG